MRRWNKLGKLVFGDQLVMFRFVVKWMLICFFLSGCKTTEHKSIDPKVLPEKLAVSAGGFMGPGFSLKFVQNSIEYSHGTTTASGKYKLQKRRIHPTEAQWAAFWSEMDRLEVWEWIPEYHPPDDMKIYDGTRWGINITHAGKHISSKGDNAYPSSADPRKSVSDFDESLNRYFEFCQAVKALIGQEFF